MSETHPSPNPDLIYDLFGGIFKPQFIRLALRLDVFTPLAAGPAPVGEIAQACGCDPAGLKALLDYLGAAQLIEPRAGRYALTLTAETFLVRGRKAYVGDMILDYTNPALYDSVLNSIRTGQPRGLNENFVQDAWLESYSTSRIPRSLEMWRAAGIWPAGEFRLLDVACGCAIKSLALAQAAPSMRVTCLDLADVLDVARDLAERLGVAERVTFHPADLLTADFGASQFEAALVGQITHYLPPEQNRAFFRRLHAALTDAGTLVIDCPMSNDTPSEAASFLTLFLWANSGGAAHPFEAYRGWLREAGFRAVERLGDRWLAARKAD